MITFWLLDEAAAPLINNELWKGIAFVLLAVVVEAVMMKWMQYNLRFGKTFLDSFIVNLASLALGFLLVSLSSFFSSLALVNLLLYYLITVVIESILLNLLNRKKLFTRTLLVTLIMNLVSYVLLAIAINFI